MNTTQERNEYDDNAVLEYYVENTHADKDTIVCAPLDYAVAETGIPKRRVRESIKRWKEQWYAEGVKRGFAFRPGVGYFYTEDPKLHRRTVIKHQVAVGNGVIRSAKTEAEQASQHDPIVREVLSRIAQGEEVTAQALAVVLEALAV